MIAYVLVLVWHTAPKERLVFRPYFQTELKVVEPPLCLSFNMLYFSSPRWVFREIVVDDEMFLFASRSFPTLLSTAIVFPMAVGHALSLFRLFSKSPPPLPQSKRRTGVTLRCRFYHARPLRSHIIDTLLWLFSDFSTGLNVFPPPSFPVTK